MKVAANATKDAARRRFPLRKLLHGDGAVTTSWAFLLVLIAVVIIGPSITGQSPTLPDFSMIAKGPLTHGATGIHLLGTDQLGRDLLARLIAGARLSLGISAVAALLASTFGVTFGILAGWFGGAADEIIMRLTDIQLAFPYILLILVLAILMPQSWATVVLVLAVTRWPMYARVVRGEVLSIKSSDYVESARALGASQFRQVVRHCLPNTLAPIIILLTFDLAANISTEAVISFLGAGVPPSTPTWGRIIADSRNYLATAWWLATFPGLAITTTLLALNVLGDWLRDIWDPRSSG